MKSGQFLLQYVGWTAATYHLWKWHTSKNQHMILKQEWNTISMPVDSGICLWNYIYKSHRTSVYHNKQWHTWVRMSIYWCEGIYDSGIVTCHSESTPGTTTRGAYHQPLFHLSTTFFNGGIVVLHFSTPFNINAVAKYSKNISDTTQ